MIGFITQEPEKKKRFETPKGKDLIILSEDAVFAPGEGGANSNCAIIGSTGSGKSFSVGIPHLLHAEDESLVVPVAKRKIVDQITPLLKSRGYTIWDLNMSHPEHSSIGYDPCKSIKDGEDMLDLAAAIVGGPSKSLDSSDDPFWGEATQNLIAAIFGLCEYQGDLSMRHAIEVYNELEISYPNGHARTTLDENFEEISCVDPDNQAPRLWSTIVGCASKTASCLKTILNNSFGRMCCDYGKSLFCKPSKKMIDLKELGKKKIALFITTSTSPMCQKISKMLYADLIKQLFNEAEAQGGELKVPVHIMFDDFCTSRVANFAEYVSIFRAARISCTILLQSLDQLSGLYGHHYANVIMDNMDNLCFLGSLNYDTCAEFAKRAGMSVEEVLNMPVGDAIVSRRGWGTRYSRRYPTPEDDVYKKYIAEPDQVRE